jgi:hypothetical protein
MLVMQTHLQLEICAIIKSEFVALGLINEIYLVNCKHHIQGVRSAGVPCGPLALLACRAKHFSSLSRCD